MQRGIARSLAPRTASFLSLGLALGLAACGGPGGPVGADGDVAMDGTAPGGDSAGPTPTEPCRSDRECSALGLLCDRGSGRCVECVQPTDCPTAGQLCTGGRCVTPVPCTTARMCPGQVCDTARGYCVDCLTDIDCPAGTRCADAQCARTSTAPRCRGPEDCATPGARVCDTVSGACVGCLTSADCGARQMCSDRACVDLPPMRVCEPASVTCADGSTLRTCNADGTAFTDGRCPEGSRCAGGRCEAPRVCEPGVTTCASPMAQRVCNSTGTTYTDVLCPVGATCAGGVCSGATVVCTAGEVRCTGTSARRVCNSTGTAYDEIPCGAATPYCSNGTCAATCAAGRGDCDGDVSNGCEVSLFERESCGRCGNVCPSGQSCVMGVCASSCGGNGQGCCFGSGMTLCQSGLGCQLGVCRPGSNCGANNIPCCEGRCNTGLRCNSETNRCESVTCQPLGGTCTNNTNCCSGLNCNTTRGACCAPTGIRCRTSGDCCGTMSCRSIGADGFGTCGA